MDRLTKNTSPLILLILGALFLSSCMPDSFKKFKKDPPKQLGSPAPEDGDDDGDDFSPDPGIPAGSELFRYSDEGTLKSQTFLLAVGENYEYKPLLDGGLQGLTSGNLDDEGIKLLKPQFRLLAGNPQNDPNYQIWAIGKNKDYCNLVSEIYEAFMPPGLTLDPSKGTIKGTPTEISTVSKTGAPLNYCVELRFRNAQGHHEYIYTSLRIGSYISLINGATFSYKGTEIDSGQRLVLEISDPPFGMTSFKEGYYLTTLNGTSAEIVFVEENTSKVYIKLNAPGDGLEFSEGALVDVQSTSGLFSSPKGRIGDVYRVYAVRENIHLARIDQGALDPLRQQNGVKFFINNSLPPSMTFNSSWVNPNNPESGGLLFGSYNDVLPRTTIEIIAINRLHPSWETAKKFSDVDMGAGPVMISEFDIEVLNRPRYLSLSNQYILELEAFQSNAFSIGDVITNNANALQDYDSVNQPFARVLHKGADFLVVQMMRGSGFEVGQNIDNRYPYSAQRARITKITPNSLIVTLANATNFQVGSSLVVLGEVVGHINKKEGHHLFISYNAKSLSGDSGLIEIGIPVTARAPGASSDLAGVSSNIANIQAYTKKVRSQFSPPIVRGRPVYSNSGGKAIVRARQDSNYYLQVENGFSNFHSTSLNLFTSAGALTNLGSINQTRFDPTFYLQRDEYVEIDLNLLIGENVKYKISPAIPLGLTLDEESDLIYGIPEDRFQKLPLTITAYNPVGETKTQFNFQVIDNFGLSLPLGHNYQSYILHREGKGNRLAPCRVSREEIEDQFDQNGQVELNCFLEAGEVELFYEGVEFNAIFPKGVCHQMHRRPYFFYGFDPEPISINSSPTIYRHTGDAQLCGKLPFSDDNEGLDPVLGAGVTSHLESYLKAQEHQNQILCLNYITGGADYSKDPDLLHFPTPPNCDERQFSITVINWKANGFICLNGDGEETNHNSATLCIDNNGQCSDTNFTSRPSCDDNGGTWTVTASHNDPDEPIYYDSSLPAINDCTPEGNSQSIQHDCGGDKKVCLYSADRQYLDILSYLEILGKGTVYNPIGAETTEQELELDAPYDRGLKSNILISNYFRDSQCALNTIPTNLLFHHIRSEDIRDHFFKTTQFLGTTPDHFMDHAHPMYTYQCINSFGDELARINLYIREWNSQFNSNDPLDVPFPNTIRSVSPVTNHNSILHGNGPGFTRNHHEITNFIFGPGSACSGASINFDFEHNGTDFEFKPSFPARRL